MVLKIPSKSRRWNGSSFFSAARRAVSFSARIISRMAAMRFSPKNMCSVRQSPIPSAPNSSAVAASMGVSALVRITSLRVSSAHDISVLNSDVNTGGCLGTSPSITSPLLPSMLIMSSGLIVMSLTVRVLRLLSIISSLAPVTQHFPQPRATTAAWLVEPPVEVKMASAACIP